MGGRRVALFDWDNTAHDGWTMEAWIDYLVACDLASSELAGGFQRAKRSYLRGATTHDDFARVANRAYARHLAGWPVEEASAAAHRFVAAVDRHRVFDFVAPLLAGLAAGAVEPMVVTGAPRPVVEAHLGRLGVAGLHVGRFRRVDGLVVRAEGGRYRGRLVRNPGVSSAKEQLVAALERAGWAVVMAAGDSTSDVPLLEGARRAGGLPLVVGRNPELVAAFGADRSIDPFDPGIDGIVARLALGR